jgi:tetratricopeptide (TPR) repeat protein
VVGRRAAAAGAIVVLAGASAAWYRGSSAIPDRSAVPPASQVVDTSRIALDRTIDALRARASADPGDGDAAARLADALMRAARVRLDAGLAIEAERALRATLNHGQDPIAERMLAGVYLAQHRFADALGLAEAALRAEPDDAWMAAVAGDALTELGRYDEAFTMFDRAAALKPDAGLYARVAYARELQGDLAGAESLMRMAVEATAAQDVEAQAWALTQLGLLQIQRGRLADADRSFRRAEFAFPAHPYPLSGRVRLAIAQRRYGDALTMIEAVPETPEMMATRGDLLAVLDRATEAEVAYAAAERLEREGWEQEEPQPGALARFLAERDRDIPAAVALAERAAAGRDDIHTMDALAWSYFKAGRLDDAAAAMTRAMRTRTADARIRCHAEAITAATRSVAASRCSPLEVQAAPAGVLRAGLSN